MASAGRWCVFIAYLGLTAFLSSQPRIPAVDKVPDYLLHAAEFVGLTVLLLRAASGSVRGPHASGALKAALFFGVCYGIVDEIHQYFVRGRHASAVDAAVDAAATAITVLVVGWLSRGAGGPGQRRPSEADGRPAPARVEMVTREGCHLCEEAGAVLTQVLGPEGTGWTAIDVDSDPRLNERYSLDVPVVFLDGVRRFKGRVDRARLVRLLREPGRLRGAASPLATAGNRAEDRPAARP